MPTLESIKKSSPDTEEYPSLQKKSRKGHKKEEETQSPWNRWSYTSGIMKLGGGDQSALSNLTNTFNSILKTKQTPDSWHKATKVIQPKKGDLKNIKNYNLV